MFSSLGAESYVPPYSYRGTRAYLFHVMVSVLLLGSLPLGRGVSVLNTTSSVSTGSQNIQSLTTYSEHIYGNPYADQTWLGPSVQAQCGASWSSSTRLWDATVPVTTETTVGHYEPEAIDTTVTFTDRYTYAASTWIWSPSPPCCLHCTILGGNVQVYYWPTPAPSPAVSTLVNSAGFTFVSPSVYVAFRSLRATDLCGNVGSPLPVTTIGFAPDALSTSAGVFHNENDHFEPYVVAYTWTAFDYKSLQSDCNNVTVTYCSNIYLSDTTSVPTASYIDCSLPSSLRAHGIAGIEYFTYTSNPCSPIISVPPQVFNLDPKWQTCIHGIQAMYDPPYALTQASGLVPVAQTTGDPAIPTTKAQSGPLPQAPATKTPAPQDPPAAPTRATTFQPQPVTQTSLPSKPESPKGIDPAVPASISAPNDPPAASNPSNNPAAHTPIIMGSQTISANSAGSVVIGSVTLQAGAPAVTINNTPVSLGSAGLMIASSTYAIPAAAPTNQPADPAAKPPALTLGSTPVTANSLSQYIVGSQTLAPAGPALIISGTTYSLPSSSPNIIFINGVPSTFVAPQPQSIPAPLPVLTLGSTPITANSASQYTFGTQTLSPGGPPLTISGTTYSLPTSSSILLINGVPSPLPTPFPQPKQTFTPTLDSASRALILDPSQTLSVGQVLTYSGEIVSLGTTTGGVPDGVVVVSGTKTMTMGLGGWIASGMGMGPTGGVGPGLTSTVGSGRPFQGVGTRFGGRGRWWGVGGVVWAWVWW